MSGVFIAILVALGFGALAYGGYRLLVSSRRTTDAAARVASRIENEGILASLFPRAGGTGSNPLGYQDPAAYGRAAKDLTEAGLSIARYVSQNQGAGGPASLSPEIVRADVGASNLDAYKAALGDGGSQLDFVDDSSQVID